MEEASPVKVDHGGNGVTVVTLDRPNGHNSFDLATATALHDGLKGVADRSGTEAVVVTGSGRFFCTGADLNEMKANAGRGARYLDELTLRSHAVVEEMRRMEKPVVTAVNGTAAGGGVGIALAGDLVVMAERARFVLAFANLGLSPDCGAVSELTRSLGPRRAREAILIDDGIGSDDALAWGLANRVVDDDALLATAVDLAARAARRAPHTKRATKRLVHLATHASLEAVLEEERRAIMAGAEAPEFQKALRDVKAGRPAPRAGKTR